MTELTLPANSNLASASSSAKARIRARYRAEKRFRFYGLAAIVLTGLFIVVVLGDILMRGVPAFVRYDLFLDVSIDPVEIDPRGTADPAVLRAGDYQALVRGRLRAMFPEVKDRSGRRLLDGILSSGAADALRDRVVADPKLVGQTVRTPIILSDDADLYFKGVGTRIERRPGQGKAVPSATDGEIDIENSVGDFSSNLDALKRYELSRANSLRREADRLRASLRSLEARLSTQPQEAATAPSASDERDSLAGEIENLTARIKDLDQQAASLQQRSRPEAGEAALDETLPSLLVAINGGLVKVSKLERSRVTGTALLPLSSTAASEPGSWQVVTYVTAESNRKISDREIAWLERLKEQELIQRVGNWSFFTAGDSREPELAGIRGALVGSALTLLVTLLICLPLGVAAAIYLEEFAAKNRITELIEVNINNLAAVPSIVFGLLGLAVFLNFFDLPRSAPLVGGLVLALLVLPTIIIASRAALKAVPPSIKEAALGVGASQQQAVLHHVLPLAMPGIMTGTIIGMAHALGETAPLLMIGMVAFIVEVPSSLTDAATVLPVQIFLWSDLPELAFRAKTAAAIIVLLAFLFVMNGFAIYLRRKFERRW